MYVVRQSDQFLLGSICEQLIQNCVIDAGMGAGIMQRPLSIQCPTQKLLALRRID